MATTELWMKLGEKVKGLSADWTAYTVVGSFILYLLGYLTLRFHLTTLGIGTDLTVLDERYLFTGTRFLVYLVSSVPIAVLLVLVLMACLYIPYRMLPAGPRGRISRYLERIQAWWTVPHRLMLTGIVFSVLMIQFVMRQCFFLATCCSHRTSLLPQTG